MTEPTDKPPLDELDEQQLDQYLKGDSSVSRQYRQLHSAEVPAELDRLVLSQAHDAVKNRKSQRPAWVRWSAPFAVAASAVLALAIVIETGPRDATMVSAPLQEQEESIATRMIEESAPPPVQADVPAPSEPKREEPRAVEMRMPELPATNASPPPVSLPAEAPPSPAQAPSVAPQAAARARSAPAPAAPAYAPAPQSLAKKSVANDAADTAKQEQVAKAAPGDAEAFAGEAAREEERTAAQRAMHEEQNLAAAAREGVDTRAPVAVYSRQISADMSALPRAYLDPEQWLKDIRQLRKDDKQEQADLEWRRFRAAYPDYEVAETDAARETKK